MKKTTIITVALTALLLVGCTGCQTRAGRWYAEQDWTPDSFSYENYRDRNLRQDQHGFGLNWNLKPDTKGK